MYFVEINIEGTDLLAIKRFDFKYLQPDIIMIECMDSRSEKYLNY